MNANETNTNNKVVEFVSKSCDEIHFPLMGVEGATLEEIDSNNATLVNQYLLTHDVATFVDASWNGGKIVILRKSANRYSIPSH